MSAVSQVARISPGGTRADHVLFGLSHEDASRVEGHERVEAIKEDLKRRLELNGDHDLRQRVEQ